MMSDAEKGKADYSGKPQMEPSGKRWDLIEKEKNTVTFGDVAGLEEAEMEVGGGCSFFKESGTVYKAWCTAFRLQLIKFQKMNSS